MTNQEIQRRKKQIVFDALEHRDRAHRYYFEAICCRSVGDPCGYSVNIDKFHTEMKQAIFDMQVSRMNLEKEQIERNFQFLEAAK